MGKATKSKQVTLEDLTALRTELETAAAAFKLLFVVKDIMMTCSYGLIK